MYVNASARGASEWPKPRWSGAMTWYLSDSSGMRSRNMNELVGKPCSRTIAGASAGPASR
ncbi:hypothetical protein SCALM49S_00102 [Streptomyces californicus]